ncbi:MAG: prolipoprotein diacylglyceryl transferase [Endomicrobium sp.]|jgi:phosphatidylglycerol:prolipoprotein diacylglycerol transferase|nr:prolipoprotein diacylglyceryl transferase [Endomicrobium sp.]
MHPILVSFFGINLYSYGLFAALGFFTAFLYISNTVNKSQGRIISQRHLQNLFLYSVIAAIVGARISYVLTNLRSFLSAPADIFKIWEGGLVYYGGFICAVLFVIFYCKSNKIDVFKFSDIIAPALALGHAFGRIGCFMAGCCYGKPSNALWSVVFSNPDSLAVKNVHIHPTQIYESLSDFIIFILLRAYNKKSHADGKTAAFYMIGYAAMRFVVEFFRGDFRGDYFFGLSPSQNISILLFACGVLLLFVSAKREKCFR